MVPQDVQIGMKKAAKMMPKCAPKGPNEVKVVPDGYQMDTKMIEKGRQCEAYYGNTLQSY